jgi:hypothetical protein
MSRSWEATLKQIGRRRLVEVDSRIQGAGRTSGFVVDYSSDLILFHVLNTEVFNLNGYSVLRSSDVKRYRAFDKNVYWQSRAIRHLGLKPARPSGIALSSLPELISSISNQYPLITIHPERKKPSVCYIGRLLSLGKAIFTLDDLDCNAEWSGPRRIRYSDATRIDFDGGYERALASMAPKRGRT